MVREVEPEYLPSSSAKLSFPRMTYERFLRTVPDDVHAEWVEGEVVLMTPVSRKHQELVGFLLNVIGVLVNARKLGKVFFEPFQMKTGRELPGRAPDILFLSNQNLGRLKDQYLDGPADLVIEIVSPGSRARDRKQKFKEYQAGEVREYWILDPERKSAEFYQLDKAGKFQSLVASKKGIIQSLVVPGLWVEEHWFWQDPHPPVLSILKKWNVI
jgi:Uma2 family endonuclease